VLESSGAGSHSVSGVSSDVRVQSGDTNVGRAGRVAGDTSTPSEGGYGPITGTVTDSDVADGSVSLKIEFCGTRASSGAVSMSSGSASGPDVSGAVTMDCGVAVPGSSAALLFDSGGRTNSSSKFMLLASGASGSTVFGDGTITGGSRRLCAVVVWLV